MPGGGPGRRPFHDDHARVQPDGARLLSVQPARLFFRVFSAGNGFALRKIVLFDAGREEPPFFEVIDPDLTGRRSELRSARPLQLIVLAQKTADVPIFATPPQQSDYAAVWASHREKNATENNGAPSEHVAGLQMKINPYWPWWLRRWRDLCRHRWHQVRPISAIAGISGNSNWEEIFRERGQVPSALKPPSSG